MNVFTVYYAQPVDRRLFQQVRFGASFCLNKMNNGRLYGEYLDIW